MNRNASPRAALAAVARWLGFATRPDTSSRQQLGQVLPIFAIMAVVLLGGAALITDVAWWWTNEQRMQRAADAAALAGSVYLPGDEVRAFNAAQAEAVKNGYTNGAQGVVVTPRRDPANPRKLIVDVDGPVQTHFARVFCWDGGPCLQRVDVGVTGAAEYVLPVPMGSPENYYGVFGMTRDLTTTSEQTVMVTNRAFSCGNAGWSGTGSANACRAASQAVSGQWQSSNTSSGNNLNNAPTANNNVYAQTGTNGNGQLHVFGGFGAQTDIPTPTAGQDLQIVGVQVRLTDAWVNSSCASARIDVQLSWDGGTNWSTALRAPTTGALVTDTSDGDYTVGSNANMTVWGVGPAGGWTRDHFSNTNFRVRLTAVENCSGNRQFNVDMLDMRVIWDFSQPTTQIVTTPVPDQELRGPGTACVTGKADCFEADGVALNPRGFWATLNTQGAANVNGDAHQAGYDTRTGTPALTCPVDNMACYDGTTFYNYAIEMPPGATNGAVYIYDPPFCRVRTGSGTGDRWFATTAATQLAVSTFYTLYNTNDTLHDLSDDTRLAPTGNGAFRGLRASDSTMGGTVSSGMTECRYRTDLQYGDGRDYHNRWYLLYSGLTGGAEGTIYRLHTTSTDPDSPTQQLVADGENSFAVYTSATTTGPDGPRIYGLGAMQAFTPLEASGSEVVSEFYLAQIEDAHAGKSIEIHLWDPGDTNPLNARLQILIPTSAGWTPTTFSYTARQGTTNSNRAACNSLTSPAGGTNIVETNVGATNGRFNGCWLIIRANIPVDYEAHQDGWWRIRYRMNGNGVSNDVTTWKVNLIGNPVHLVPE